MGDEPSVYTEIELQATDGQYNGVQQVHHQWVHHQGVEHQGQELGFHPEPSGNPLDTQQQQVSNSRLQCDLGYHDQGLH